jgi:DNA-binding transcriptional LysR family regulator
MTLTQLEYFLALAEFQSFSQAAKACGVTQPTLSAQFQKLEEELGHALVDRKAQPMALTPMGQSLLGQARQTLQSAEGIKRLVDDFEHPVVGRLRLGIVAPLAGIHGAEWYAAVQAACPHVELDLVEANPADLQQALQQAELDAVLTQSEGWTGQGQTTVLFQEAWWALAPKEEALLPAWSDGQAWLMGSEALAATRFARLNGWKAQAAPGFQSDSVYGRASVGARTGKWVLLSESELELLPAWMQKRARPVPNAQRSVMWVRGLHTKNEAVQERVRAVLASRVLPGLRSAQ